MKFICTQENLLRGLNIVSHIAGKNINLPILNNILIKAEAGKINLSSTNLDIGINTAVRGKMETGGELTIQARLLTDYINLLAAGQNITIEKKENDLKLATETQETVMRGQAAEDYPIIPEMEEINEIGLSNQEFKQALGQVIFSASYDDTRPEISGVLFTLNDKQLIMAATDSYRLAEKKLKLGVKPGGDILKIIPLRVLQEVSRILEEEGEIKLYFNDNQVMFKTSDTKIISRLIEGNYPDYKQIIPTGYKTKINLDKNELIKLVKAASLFTKAGINDVLIDFNKKGQLEVSANNAQLGENKSKMMVAVEGESNKIVFNYKYLLDGLNNMPTKKITLEITSPEAPAVMRPAGEEGYLYLIMPIRQ